MVNFDSVKRAKEGTARNEQLFRYTNDSMLLGIVKSWLNLGPFSKSRINFAFDFTPQVDQNWF